jgi:hypothetical protein
MEPGVTVWGRAGSSWALPRSCIYRCRISTVVKIGALDSCWSRRDAGLVDVSLSADVPLTTTIEHMFLSVKGCSSAIFSSIALLVRAEFERAV